MVFRKDCVVPSLCCRFSGHQLGTSGFSWRFFISLCDFLLFANWVQQDFFFFIFFLDVRLSSLLDGSVIFFLNFILFPSWFIFPVPCVLFIKGRQEAWSRAGSCGRAHDPGRGYCLYCLSHPFAQPLLGIQLILPPCHQLILSSCHSSPKPHRQECNLGVRILHATSWVIFPKHRHDCLPTRLDPHWVTTVT